MVSLGDESNRSGGFFFDQPNHSLHSESDELLADPSLTDQEPLPFRKIHTTPSIAITIFFVVCLEIALFLVPHFCPDEQCGVSPFSILLYTHSALWFFFLLMDRFWRFQHYESRTSGYLEFYRSTRHLRRAPMLVFSGGCAVLISISTVLSDFCRSQHASPDACPGQSLTKSNYLQILVSLELAVILPILLLYLVLTVKFNRAQRPPDIQEEDVMSVFVQNHSHSTDVGFRDETFTDEILEKQADMIRYLKQHNQHLGKKILQLTAEINSRMT